MPAAEELIAHGRSEDEVRRLIGADQLFYQDLEDLIECASEGNPLITDFECSVFTGEYVTGNIDRSYLDLVSSLRADKAKARREARVRSGTAYGGCIKDL